MDAGEYEQYVARLVKELDCFRSGTVYTNRRFAGVRQPGEYEIDVAVEASLSDVMSFLLIIECKNWKRPIDRPVIQKLAQTRDAIAAHKAAVVSPVGFTDEAVEVARVHGIALWVIAEGAWEQVSYAGPPLGWIREYHSLRLSLLDSLGIVGPRLHRAAVVGFSHVLPGPGVAPWNRYVYRCVGGSGDRDPSCRPGVDDRTALSEIADAMFAEARRHFVASPVRAWLTRAEQQLISNLGLGGEDAALAAQAVAANDIETFGLLAGSGGGSQR